MGSMWWVWRDGGHFSGPASAFLALRVITGCIGSWGWLSVIAPPDFWGYNARWVMEFFPASVLSWSRQRAVSKFITRLEPDVELRVKLCAEQEAYYGKGALCSELGLARREMRSWAAAMAECHWRWNKQSEAERMKSASARLKALENLGVSKSAVPESLRSLERLELSELTKHKGTSRLPPRRL